METKYIERYSRSQKGAKLLDGANPDTCNTQMKPIVPAISKSYILGQAFLMTFLAEWGDRSQIATIALAASFNPFMVTLGALLGHLLCTAAAVKIGELVSGKISEQKILIVGGIVFIVSGLCTFVLVIE
jgi:putative Ca2+/H+ antiporter (TMEM165/GDT1 family)